MTEHTEQKLLDFMPQPRWWHRYVSWLLYLANSDAPTWKNYRYAFYGLKDLILNSRAIECGVDWQRFTKPCWSCDGTGYFTHGSGDKELCNRCYASGVYSVYYVKLHRLSFGGRVFHKPGDSQSEKQRDALSRSKLHPDNANNHRVATVDLPFQTRHARDFGALLCSSFH